MIQWLSAASHAFVGLLVLVLIGTTVDAVWIRLPDPEPLEALPPPVAPMTGNPRSARGVAYMNSNDPFAAAPESTSTEEAIEPSSASADEYSEVRRPMLRLKGTVLNSARSGFAVIEAYGEVRIVPLADTVAGFRLTDLAPSGATLSSADTTVNLTIESGRGSDMDR